jgi:hypothetical protein
MFTAELFLIAKSRKYLNTYQLLNVMNKMYYPIKEYYLAMERNEALIYAIYG